MGSITYDQLKAVREAMAAPWFSEPYSLNLVIARTNHVGQWDDRLFVACVDDHGRRIVERFACTGDAWQGEWTDPTHPDGCVYVLDQHVPGGLKRGTHKGRPALVQVKPFRCVRWPRSMARVPTVDDLEALAASGAAFIDNRGCNVHNRHSGAAPEAPARDDSEGCTVLLHWHRHAMLMEMVAQQARFRGTEVVSPTYVRREAFGL